MANLSFKNVCKDYPLYLSKKERGSNTAKTVRSVDNFNLEIKDGEFVVFVGPSGCGKSTTLRMIAGLEKITGGEIYIDDVCVNDIPPKDRNISMVFQNYALYPHMTVYDNICFPLNYTRFVSPVEAREQEIKNAEAEINRTKAAIENEKKNKDNLSVDELNKIIENNLAFIEEAKKELEIAKATLAEMTPTKDEWASYKKMVKDKTGRFLNDETYIKCRKYHELTRHRYSKEDKDEIIRRVARLVDVEEYLGRKPKALSGGQRQRVALARALVRSPKVFLLDEPLSNLDAKLRTQMRSEIVELHNKIKTTFIYVTHDQVEAMTMGDRIVVMKDGVIQQVDTPTNLFDYPENKFVAGFIGTPQMNFFDVEIKKNGTSLIVKFESNEEISLPLKECRTIKPEYLNDEFTKVTLGIRSEDIALGEKGLTGKLNNIEVLGNETHLFVGSPVSQKQIIARIYDRVSVKKDDELHLVLNPAKIHLFAKNEEENSIMER